MINCDSNDLQEANEEGLSMKQNRIGNAFYSKRAVPSTTHEERFGVQTKNSLPRYIANVSHVTAPLIVSVTDTSNERVALLYEQFSSSFLRLLVSPQPTSPSSLVTCIDAVDLALYTILDPSLPKNTNTTDLNHPQQSSTFLDSENLFWALSLMFFCYSKHHLLR